jgi:hypothetical protein
VEPYAFPFPARLKVDSSLSLQAQLLPILLMSRVPRKIALVSDFKGEKVQAIFFSDPFVVLDGASAGVQPI